MQTAFGDLHELKNSIHHLQIISNIIIRRSHLARVLVYLLHMSVRRIHRFRPFIQNRLKLLK